MRLKVLFAVALMIGTPCALATSFVVPTDEEMVAKSAAIAIATVEGAYAQEANGTIETVYELRVERALKGAPARGELLRIHSLGGILENAKRGMFVPGEAHFDQGDRVLLFLKRDAHGRWRTTDMTLGKFRFVTSTKGERLLVRDMEDVVGWDHAGGVHREQVRKEEGFLRFVQERARGREVPKDYVVDASQVTLAAEEESVSAIGTNAAPFPAATYTDWVNNQPVRWGNGAQGLIFYKRSDQNIAGASDGGVSVIEGGLGAWTNDCASNITMSYGGQVTKGSTNHDSTNVVEFNDPQGRISGSWSGSGTVGVCFISFAGEHPFAGQSWLSITDADVVFQDGYTASNSSFSSAMTHELGHGLGWRHSNQDYASGGACNTATQECTTAAVMNSAVSANYGFTLQPWDQHAAESVYPGGTCGPVCAPPAIVSHPQGGAVTPGTVVTLSVTASGTAPLSYQWYIGQSGNTGNPIPGANTSSITVVPGATTNYWVRVATGCGSANSNTATITVTTTALASSTASGLFVVAPCRAYDSRNSSPIAPGSVELIPMSGRCGVPTGAKSVVINVTAIVPSTNGFLTVYPGTGASPPGTSTLNYRANRTRANNAIMRLSADGRLSVYNGGPAVHFLIDVMGYFQ